MIAVSHLRILKHLFLLVSISTNSVYIYNLFKLRGEHSQFGADKRKEKKGKKIDSDVVDIGEIYHPHFGLEINTKRPHCFAENRSPWLLGPFRMEHGSQPPTKRWPASWCLAMYAEVCHQYIVSPNSRQHHHAALLGHRGIGCFASWERFCVADPKRNPRIHGCIYRYSIFQTFFKRLHVENCNGVGGIHPSVRSRRSFVTFFKATCMNQLYIPIESTKVCWKVHCFCGGKQHHFTTPFYIRSSLTASIHGSIILPTPPTRVNSGFPYGQQKSTHRVEVVKRLRISGSMDSELIYIHFFSRIRIRNHQKISVEWLDTNPSYPLLGQNHHEKPSFLHLAPPPSPWLSSTRTGYRPWNHIGSEIGALARSSVWRDRPWSVGGCTTPPAKLPLGPGRQPIPKGEHGELLSSGTKMAMETWKIHPF